MGRLKKILKGEQGFTLLELMISLAVFSIGMLGIIGMFTYSIGGNAQGRNMSKAVSLAGKKMEDLKLTAFKDLTSTVGSGENNGIYNIKFTTRKEITGLEMRKATVIVTWSMPGASWENKPVTHQVRLTSTIAKQ